MHRDEATGMQQGLPPSPFPNKNADIKHQVHIRWNSGLGFYRRIPSWYRGNELTIGVEKVDLIDPSQLKSTAMCLHEY